MFINQNRPFYCYRLGCVSTQKKCSSVTEILPMFWREPVLLAPAHCWDISPFLQQQTTSNSTCLPYKVCIAFTTWKWYHKHWAGLSSHESTSIMTSHQYRKMAFCLCFSFKNRWTPSWIDLSWESSLICSNRWKQKNVWILMSPSTFHVSAVARGLSSIHLNFIWLFRTSPKAMALTFARQHHNIPKSCEAIIFPTWNLPKHPLLFTRHCHCRAAPLHWPSTIESLCPSRPYDRLRKRRNLRKTQFGGTSTLMSTAKTGAQERAKINIITCNNWSNTKQYHSNFTLSTSFKSQPDWTARFVLIEHL